MMETMIPPQVGMGLWTENKNENKKVKRVCGKCRKCEVRAYGYICTECEGEIKETLIDRRKSCKFTPSRFEEV